MVSFVGSAYLGVAAPRTPQHNGATPFRRSPAVLRRALVGDTRTRWYGRRPGGWPRSPKHLLRTTCCRRPYGEMCPSAAAPFVAPIYHATICVPVDRAYPRSHSCLNCDRLEPNRLPTDGVKTAAVYHRRPECWAKRFQLSCSSTCYTYALHYDAPTNQNQERNI